MYDDLKEALSKSRAERQREQDKRFVESRAESKAKEKACAETKTDITTKEEVLTSPRSALSVFGLLMSGALLHALFTLAVHAAATALKTLPNSVGFA